MLKILIKKQFYECFRGYFVSNKTGKAKSKAGIIGMFALFAFVMLTLAACFFGLAATMVELLSTKFSWLYFAVFGLMTIGLGTFASVFNTSSSLYNAKDNDLLLSLPIEPKHILISRVVLVYGLSLLYSSVAWLPICLYAMLVNGFSFIICLFDILLLFIITIFTTALSCLLGYIIACITRKVKNKSITTVVLSLLFLGVYYFLCFRLEKIINSIVENSDKIANAISTWAQYIYQLALAAQGNILSFIIYTIINLIIGALCYVLLERNYAKLIIGAKNVSASKGKVVYKANNNVSTTLLKKEAKRFISSPTYLLNCGLGSLFVLAAGVAMIIKKNDINLVLDAIKEFLPEANSFIPLIIIGVIGLVGAMGVLAVPSISLEGKNLWILKSLPIDTYKILNAKKTLQLLVNGIPSIISGLLMCYAFKLDLLSTMYICIVIYFFAEIQACVNCLLSLVNPNFSWTSEVQPIKQSMTVLYAMIVTVVIVTIIIAPYYFVRNSLNIADYLQTAIIAMAIIIILLRKLIRTWGVKKFESL